MNDTTRTDGSRAAEPTFDFDGGYGEGYEALAHQLIPGYASIFQMAVALLDLELGTPDRAAEPARDASSGSVARDATASSPPHILVVGAGTGVEMVTFKRHRPDWRCTGVDPSAQMLDFARARLAEAAVGDGVAFHEGFVGDLPTEATFDAATSFNVMHFIPDDGSKADFLSDIAAHLGPGAPFVLFDLFGEPGSEDLEWSYAAWRAYWAVREFAGAPRDAFREKIDTGIHWAGEPRIRELLTEGGFTDVRAFFRGFVYGGWIARRA
ncbi:MAG: class I SAM-dependent methyltransferase [Gemmatimonadetes bacterium]|nr:class I SAM-dependent methyltransferase [Gemmatimonadota bacterium]